MSNKCNICLNTDKYQFFLWNGGKGAELALETEVPRSAAANQGQARWREHTACWAFHTQREASPEVYIGGLFSSGKSNFAQGGPEKAQHILNSMSVLLKGLKSKVFRSNFMEFCNNQHSYHLIKWTTDAETPFIWTPVQTGNGLGGQRHVLQKADWPRNSHLHSLRIFLWPLSRVFVLPEVKAAGTPRCQKELSVLWQVSDLPHSRFMSLFRNRSKTFGGVLCSHVKNMKLSFQRCSY